jgi:hypothetical protein
MGTATAPSDQQQIKVMYYNSVFFGGNRDGVDGGESLADAISIIRQQTHMAEVNIQYKVGGQILLGNGGRRKGKEV